MRRYGEFCIRPIYYKKQKHWLVSKLTGGYDFHTHILGDNLTAAMLIAKRAQQGSIPKDYPKWMIKSINRLWYGKNTDKMDMTKDNIISY